MTGRLGYFIAAGLFLSAPTAYAQSTGVFISGTTSTAAFSGPPQLSSRPIESAGEERSNDCGNSDDPIMPQCFEYAGHRYNRNHVYRGAFVVLIMSAVLCGFYYAGRDV